MNGTDVIDTTAVAKTETVKSLVAMPSYRMRFDEVLGKERAAAFLGSLTALTAEKSLGECEPRSVVAAAFIAATLDLPIQKGLGFAWIIPYKEGGGKPVAQFQIGWKGIVQLALRSGQFRRLNAYPVNQDAFKGNDEFAEAIIDHQSLDDEKDPAGFAVSWELLNGFRKTVYWTYAKCIRHAAKYSQSYRTKGTSKRNAWNTSEPEMCMKTVVNNAGKKWWPMSVSMERAFEADSTVRHDIDDEPTYIDANTTEVEALPPMPKEIGEEQERTLEDEIRELGECLGKPSADINQGLKVFGKAGKLEALRDQLRDEYKGKQ
jgi:recombination protein RecT